MNTALLEHVIKHTPLTLEESFEMTPETLAEKLSEYVTSLENIPGCEETHEILTCAIMVAKEYKDVLLLWLTSMTLHGMVSPEALDGLTNTSCALLGEEDAIYPSMADLDADSIFYSFSKKVLPEILESINSVTTLFCFREYFDAPKRFKSMLNMCCVVAELDTFPDYDRYNIDIEIEQVYAADIRCSIMTLNQLAYLTTLLHVTKGETSLGAAMAKWAKSEIKYPKVYRSICAALGIVDFEDDLAIN